MFISEFEIEVVKRIPQIMKSLRAEGNLNDDDIKDIIQDVRIRLLDYTPQHKAKLIKEGAVSYSLMRVVKNVKTDFYRKRQADERLIKGYLQDREHELTPHDRGDDVREPTRFTLTLTKQNTLVLEETLTKTGIDKIFALLKKTSEYSEEELEMEVDIIVAEIKEIRRKYRKRR